MQNTFVRADETGQGGVVCEWLAQHQSMSHRAVKNFNWHAHESGMRASSNQSAFGDRVSAGPGSTSPSAQYPLVPPPTHSFVVNKRATSSNYNVVELVMMPCPIVPQTPSGSKSEGSAKTSRHLAQFALSYQRLRLRTPICACFCNSSPLRTGNQCSARGQTASGHKLDSQRGSVMKLRCKR